MSKYIKNYNILIAEKIVNQKVDEQLLLIKNKLGDKIYNELKSNIVININDTGDCHAFDYTITIGTKFIDKNNKPYKENNEFPLDGKWNLYFKTRLDESILHEICHLIDYNIFATIGKFGEKRSLTSDNWNFDINKSSTTYGKTNKEEDFVATMMFYLTDRKKSLKEDRDKFIDKILDQWI